MTTITAILPTYNRAHTLPRALASVFAQTRPPDEVIVVDDASTDDTAAVVAGFPGARLLRLDRNGGASRARNAGVREATGSLLAFIDSDDVWVANKLETQLFYLQSNPQVDLLCTGITVNERSGKVASHGFDFRAPAAGWTFAELQTYPFSTPTWLIRREAFIANGMFDESLANCEDLDFLARMLARHRIEMLRESLVVKYNQSDSINSDLKRTAESYAVLFERHRALWARTPAAMATTRLRLANMHVREGDMARVRAELLRALRLQPLRPRLWLLLLASIFGPRAYTRARLFRT